MNEVNILVDVFAEENRIYVEERHDTFLQINPLGDDIKLNIEDKNVSVITVATDEIVGVRLFNNFQYNDGSTFSFGDADTLDGYHAIEFPRKAEWASITGRWNFLNRIGIKADNHTAILADLHNFGTTILHDTVQFGGDLVSENGFASGFTGYGWKLDSETNHLTVDHLTVRKQLRVYELLINQIRATNGSVWISDACRLLSVTYNTDNYRCYIDTSDGTIAVPFRVGDLIRCQRWNGKGIKYYSAQVTYVSNEFFDLDKASKDGDGFPEANDDLVRIGNISDTNRQGALYLTASDDNAPYMDVLDGVRDYSFQNKVKVRLGKLTGITYKGVELTGYGLFADNAYLMGAISNVDGKWALNSDGSGQLASGGISWTSNGTVTIGNYLSNDEFTSWVAADFDPLAQRVQGAEDGQFVLYYQSTDPSANFVAPYSNYVGDQWYDTYLKIHYWWKLKSTNPDVYGWVEMERQDIINAYDLADGKRRIFVEEPRTPYERGDLWLTGGLNPSSGEIMKCTVDRPSQAPNPEVYVAADWVIAADYNKDVDASKIHIGGLDPSTNWTTDIERAKHVNDIWYKEELINGATELVRHFYMQVSPAPTFDWIRDETKIDGGRIFTGTVKAQQIDVESLVADEAFITNVYAMLIEGHRAEIDSGRIGNFEIDNRLYSINATGGIILDPDEKEISILNQDEVKIRIKHGPLSSMPYLYTGGTNLVTALESDLHIEQITFNEHKYGISKMFLIELASAGTKPLITPYANVSNPATHGSIVPQNTRMTARLPLTYEIVHEGAVGDDNVPNRIIGNWRVDLVFMLYLSDGVNTKNAGIVTIKVNEHVDFDTGLKYRMVQPTVTFETENYNRAYWVLTAALPNSWDGSRYNALTYIWWDKRNNWFDDSEWKYDFDRTIRHTFKVDPGMSFSIGKGMTEIGSNGFQSVWTPDAYFRVDGDSDVFIQSRGKWEHNGYIIDFTKDGDIVGNIDPGTLVRAHFLTDNYYDKTTSDNRFARLANNNSFTGNQTITGNLIVNGNIIQQGDTYTTHAEEVYSANDLIIARDGAIAALAVNEISGLKILKANGTSNLIIGGDRSGLARVGWEGGTLQAIATREDVPTNNYVAVWSSINSRFNTTNVLSLASVTVSGLTNTGSLRVQNTATFDQRLEGNITFVSGFSGAGWRIDSATNHLTIDHLTVRQSMNVYELRINQIRATNGSLWLSDAAKVGSVAGSTVTIDTGGGSNMVPFVVNDLLKCQTWSGKTIKSYVIRVASVTTTQFTFVYVSGGTSINVVQANDELVRIGNTTDTSRQGSLYLTASDSYSPYIDVIEGVNSASFAGKTRLRVGDISGISGQTGYGLWASADGVNTTLALSSNGYAKVAGWNADHTKLSSGNIEISTSGYIRHTGDKWRLNSDGSFLLSNGNFHVDAAGNLTAINGSFQGHIESTTGLIGGFTIGSYFIKTNYLELVSYDAGDSVLRLRSDANGMGSIAFYNGASVRGFLSYTASNNTLNLVNSGPISIQSSNPVTVSAELRANRFSWVGGVNRGSTYVGNIAETGTRYVTITFSDPAVSVNDYIVFWSIRADSLARLDPNATLSSSYYRISNTQFRIWFNEWAQLDQYLWVDWVVIKTA